MINEKQIQYLMTVAKEQNITLAAKKLFISQPALSRMILDLERSLGADLFVRERGRLHLTQAGEIYLKGCRDVLTVSRAVLKEISDLKNSKSGKITLGVTSATGEFLLPHILDAFEQNFPHVKLILAEERMDSLQSMVKTGEADIALVYQAKEAELEYRLLLENSVYVQVPPFFIKGRDGWKPGTQNPDILLEDLSGQPMILLKKGRGMRQVADQFLAQSKISFGNIIETENIHLASDLVCLNRGFSFIPNVAINRRFQNHDNRFYCQIRDYPLQRSLYCCYRKNVYLTEAERFLIDLISRTQH